jgi:hypothetical protein
VANPPSVPFEDDVIAVTGKASVETAERLTELIEELSGKLREMKE